MDRDRGSRPTFHWRGGPLRKRNQSQETPPYGETRDRDGAVFGTVHRPCTGVKPELTVCLRTDSIFLRRFFLNAVVKGNKSMFPFVEYRYGTCIGATREKISVP